MNSSGSISISSTLITLNSEDMRKNVNSKRYNIRRKPIVNECFYVAMEGVTDNMWLIELENASRNIFPRGVSYVNNRLIYRSGNKIIESDSFINQDNVADMYIRFMNRYLYKISDTQIKRSRYKISSSKINKWGDISQSINVFSMYVTIYFDDIYGTLYSNRIKDTYVKLAKVCKNMGLFSSNNVKIKDGKISSIPEYMYYDEDAKSFILTQDGRVNISRSIINSNIGSDVVVNKRFKKTISNRLLSLSKARNIP